MTRTERCETCRFWHKVEYDPHPDETEEERKDRLDNQDMLSSCRIRSVQTSMFPNRRAADWCSEWKSSKQPIPVNSEGVSVRLMTWCQSNGIKTLNQLAEMTFDEFSKRPRVTAHFAADVDEILRCHGLNFRISENSPDSA